MKMIFNLDDDLPPKKRQELRNMVIAVWSVFHEGIIKNIFFKYYPQVFLDESWYKS